MAARFGCGLRHTLSDRYQTLNFSPFILIYVALVCREAFFLRRHG